MRRLLSSAGVEAYASETPVVFSQDHRALFRLREFHNLLQQKKWLHEDMLRTYERVRQSLADLSETLEVELR